jgi:hypothetical protein
MVRAVSGSRTTGVHAHPIFNAISTLAIVHSVPHPEDCGRFYRSASRSAASCHEGSCAHRFGAAADARQTLFEETLSFDDAPGEDVGDEGHVDAPRPVTTSGRRPRSWFGRVDDRAS